MASGIARPRAWSLRGLSVIAFAHGVSDFYAGTVSFTIFLVISNQHTSPAYQGLLMFVWYLTSSIVQPFFGAYTDRHGRWWFLPAALTLTMTALSIAAMLSSVWLLAVCLVIGGIGSAVLHPEAGKYSAMLSGSRRASGISIFQIGGQLGYALGPAAIATLYSHLGSRGSLVMAVPGVLAVAALFRLMRHVDRKAEEVHASSQPSAASEGPVDRIGIGLIMTSTALRHFTSTAFITFLPNVLVGRGFSSELAGDMVTAFLLISSVGLYAGGALSDRYGPVRISIAALVGSVPFLLSFFILTGPLGILALLIGSALLAVQNAPGVSMVQAMLPKNLGMALGLMNGVSFGAGSALVAGIGVAVATFGASASLEAASLSPLIAALSYVILRDRVPALRVRSAA
jgi:FSR family fosmidomycin resistance protein-like MFS transporter